MTLLRRYFLIPFEIFEIVLKSDLVYWKLNCGKANKNMLSTQDSVLFLRQDNSTDEKTRLNPIMLVQVVIHGHLTRVLDSCSGGTGRYEGNSD